MNNPLSYYVNLNANSPTCVLGSIEQQIARRLLHHLKAKEDLERLTDSERDALDSDAAEEAAIRHQADLVR